MAQEHEMLSLGGQAAEAAHSLGTPLSTIKIITQELSKQLKDQKDVIQDIQLLSSQVERCNEILKKLSLDPNQEDDYIDEDIAIRDYLRDNNSWIYDENISNLSNYKLLNISEFCNLFQNCFLLCYQSFQPYNIVNQFGINFKKFF